jgi:uroporphyrinogen decarboxylase
MNSRERVLSAINRTGYDRIPVKHEATPEINKKLFDVCGLKNMEQLLRVVGDDFRYIAPTYIGPELRAFPDGSIEGYWGERYKYVQFERGRYLESVYKPFENIDSLSKLDRSHFPSANWFDYSTIGSQIDSLQGQFAVCAGSPGDMDFINGISRARGMEQVLIDLIEGNSVYLELMQARFEFYYNLHERILKTAGGRIDIMHIGEDLGNQNGPMISLDIFERYFAAKYKKYFKMVHSYGAKIMQHMCGCVVEFLPRLIELGLDIYDVVQPTTVETDIAQLQKHFGHELGFCGSVCVQTTLAWGTVTDVATEVDRRLKLFPSGGLFLGPSHAIQAGSPIENVLALYKQAGSFCPVDDLILKIKPNRPIDMIDMSKLF